MCHTACGRLRSIVCCGLGQNSYQCYQMPPTLKPTWASPATTKDPKIIVVDGSQIWDRSVADFPDLRLILHNLNIKFHEQVIEFRAC